VFNLAPPTHDVTDEISAYKLASEPFPGYFGVFYKANKPTKNAREAEIIANARAKVDGAQDWQILQKSFQAMR
jgi:2-oxoglutarate/2-oxoacid ferredoxin oxidoreductase subunit beta